MAATRSAKKSIRQNETNRARNRWRKGQIKAAILAFEEALEKGDTTAAANELKACYKTIDQVAAKGTIHKNTAARKKSSLANQLAKPAS